MQQEACEKLEVVLMDQWTHSEPLTALENRPMEMNNGDAHSVDQVDETLCLVQMDEKHNMVALNGESEVKRKAEEMVQEMEHYC